MSTLTELSQSREVLQQLQRENNLLRGIRPNLKSNPGNPASRLLPSSESKSIPSHNRRILPTPSWPSNPDLAALNNVVTLDNISYSLDDLAIMTHHLPYFDSRQFGVCLTCILYGREDLCVPGPNFSGPCSPCASATKRCSLSVNLDEEMHSVLDKMYLSLKRSPAGK